MGNRKGRKGITAVLLLAFKAFKNCVQLGLNAFQPVMQSSLACKTRLAQQTTEIETDIKIKTR